MATQFENAYMPQGPNMGTNSPYAGDFLPRNQNGNVTTPDFQSQPGADPSQGQAQPLNGPEADTSGWDNQIHGYYSNFLGRSGSPDEVGGWINSAKANPGGLGWAQNQIANSPEAMAYANRGQQTASGAPAPGSGTNGAASASNFNFNLTGAPQNQELIDLLMKRAKGSLNIDPTTDPIIRPQVDNYAAAQERSRRNFLNETAESSNPYATGMLNTARTQTAERAGQNTADFQGTLMQNELGSRRKEIQDALTEAGSLLTAQQQLSLQKELGLIDSALKQQQINSGNDQFAGTLGLNTTNMANYWDAVRSGLL